MSIIDEAFDLAIKLLTLMFFLKSLKGLICANSKQKDVKDGCLPLHVNIED